MKNQDMYFWRGILILNTTHELHYDDITVPSFINLICGCVAIEGIPHICYSFSVAKRT